MAAASAAATKAAAVPSFAVGCDHGGFVLRDAIVARLKELGAPSVTVFGAESADTAIDYPDVAQDVADKVLASTAEAPVRGIVICGTGNGINIAANKIDGIRSALCHDHFTAQMCRLHNDANVLALGGRTTGLGVALEIVDTFVATEFMGAHHVTRLEKVAALEKK